MMIEKSNLPDGLNTLPKEDKKEIVETKKLAILSPEKSVEQIVRARFKDTPILIEISKCESRFTQLNKDGTVHRGRVNKNDLGAMQVNSYYHIDTAQKLGYDLYTLEGNLDYAEYLYKKEGTRPWNSSKPCWGSKEEIAMR
ncbi:MAG: hypothetical protein QG585_167 [Patescibacteria group bacterium]|jgi:hypothetical protein|nr:hypothetical protein [Patescibacteria group bacterium]